MLWKTIKPEGLGGGTNGGSSSPVPGDKLINLNGVDTENHRKLSLGFAKRQTGVVIYPFQNYVHVDCTIGQGVFLELELGESVTIISEPVPGWFYGWRKFCPDQKGLFPGELF